MRLVRKWGQLDGCVFQQILPTGRIVQREDTAVISKEVAVILLARQEDILHFVVCTVTMKQMFYEIVNIL